jgi:hypothetical protein
VVAVGSEQFAGVTGLSPQGEPQSGRRRLDPMAATSMIVVVPQGIVNWDDSVECAKTDVVDRASPVRQRFRRVQ